MHRVSVSTCKGIYEYVWLRLSCIKNGYATNLAVSELRQKAAMEIKLAEIGQADILTDLTRRSKAHWGYDEAQILKWYDELRVHEDDIRAERVWVGMSGNQVVGYYSFLILSASVVKLDNLFIAPQQIGKGLGKILLTHFLDRGKDMGFQRATLDAEPHAEAFYKRFGFETIDSFETSIPDRYIPVMEREL